MITSVISVAGIGWHEVLSPVKFKTATTTVSANRLRVFRATLNFWRWLWTPFREFFSNFAKSCILSCWLQFNNNKGRSLSSFLSYNWKRLKLKLRVFLAGHIVAMVTYTLCHKINSNLFTDDWAVCWYHDLGVNQYRAVMTHQTLSLEKYWKLFSATLKDFVFPTTLLQGSLVFLSSKSERGETLAHPPSRRVGRWVTLEMRLSFPNYFQNLLWYFFSKAREQFSSMKYMRPIKPRFNLWQVQIG